MLTLGDIMFTSILPLTLGMSVAVFLGRLAPASPRHAIGSLTTLVAGYFGYFARMDFAYADGETIPQKVAQSISQTATGLLTPSTAIQWIPIFAAAALTITIIVARVQFTGNAMRPEKTQPQSRFSRWAVFGWFVALIALAFVRLLWSSVYFTDRFVLAAQVGYVVVPALLIGAVWAGAFCPIGTGRPQKIWQNTSGQRIARLSHLSTLLLSASALVLLGCSGSFTVAMLQIPALSAALISFVFHPSDTNDHGLSSDAWLVASSICVPVAIGFFFAQLRWEAAILFAISSILVTWMPPLTHDSKTKKAVTAIAPCLPAVAVAIWAAIVLSQTIAPPYGGY
jgi:hypothetical protein